MGHDTPRCYDVSGDILRDTPYRFIDGIMALSLQFYISYKSIAAKRNQSAFDSGYILKCIFDPKYVRIRRVTSVWPNEHLQALSFHINAEHLRTLKAHMMQCGKNTEFGCDTSFSI